MTTRPLYDLGRIVALAGVDIDTRAPFVAVRAIESTAPKGGVARTPQQALVMHGQVTPNEARTIAVDLLAAAAEAEADAAVVTMLAEDDAVRVLPPATFVGVMRSVRARMAGRG